MKKRIEWLDFGKGFAIFLVVLGHLFLGIYQSRKFPASNDVWLLTILEWFYITHIPLFFALSGYLYRAPQSFSHYIKGQYKKLIVLGIPYLVYSLVQFILQTIGGGEVRDAAGIKGLLGIYKQPLSISWYIYILFFTYLFLGLLFLILKKKRAVFVVSVIGFIISLLWPIPVYLIQRVLLWSFFFMLGNMMNDAKVAGWLKNYRKFINASYPVIIALVLFSWISLGNSSYTSYDSPGLWALVFLAGIILAFANFPHLKHGKVFRYFQKYGKDSLVIYLVHAPILSVTRILLLKLGISSISLHIIIGFIFGWFGSCFVLYLIKNIPYLDFFFYPNKYLMKR